MRISPFGKIIKKLFPFDLAPFEFNGQINPEVKKTGIQKIGLTLGYSKKTVLEAIKKEVDVLIVHNVPEIINNKINYFKEINQMCQKHKMVLFKVHLPMDFASGGIMDCLCQLLNLQAKPINVRLNQYLLKNGLFLADQQHFSFESIVQRIKNLKPKTIRVAGFKRKSFRKIAVASGDGCKPEFLLQVKPDGFIAGLLNQESIRIAEDLGITLFEATSVATENEPLKIIHRNLQKTFRTLPVEFIDPVNSVGLIT